MDLQVNVHNFEHLRSRPPARYLTVRLDANDTCNLHCVYCHNHRTDRVIDLGDLRAFLHGAIIETERFQIGCVMEPTMDPRLVDVMLAVKLSPARPTGDLQLQTNGLLLHRHDAGKMVAAGLSLLSVSLDTADPTTQKVLRDGMSLRKVMRNIETFRAAAPDVALEIIGVVTRSNIGKVSDLVALAISLGACRVVLRQLLYYPDSEIVDRGRMPALVIRRGQFLAMADRIRAQFDNRIELVFAANDHLDASARRMVAESGRIPPPEPQLYA